jgi:pimeloyl-ACP methyl ester carboxylesterase
MELIGRSVRPRIVRIPLIDDASLRGLTVPLLAIVGGKDVLLDSEGARRRLADTAPQAEMLFLSAAHHLILGQGQTILDFLSQGRAN